MARFGEPIEPMTLGNMRALRNYSPQRDIIAGAISSHRNCAGLRSCVSRRRLGADARPN
jgi:hypothetical protein